MDLNFDVCKQIITRTDTEKVVNLSDNYLRLCFTFKGTDWDDLSKFVLVHHKRGTTRLELDNEDGVTLPDGLLLSDKLDFTVYGVDDPADESLRVTTNKQRIYLLDSSYTDEYSEIAEVIDIHTIRDMYVLIDTKANASDMATALNGKVDKITGKGLSSNDYTDSDKNIVSHIEDDLEQALQQLEATVIDSINARVKYTDVKDNLTSSDTDKPLSAKQGKILKDTVDLKANTSDMTTALNGKSNVGHTHTKSDVTDFAHNHDDRYYTESEVDTKLNGKANSTHSHTKSDITDFIHTHTKSDITDFAHNHDDRYYTETEIDTALTGKSDIGHTHDERYYTESEVNTMLNDLKEDLTNRVVFEPSKNIMQTDDTNVFKAYCIKNGLPVYNQEVCFYDVFDPVTIMEDTGNIVQAGDTLALKAKVKDSNDGSLVKGVEVKFYKITDDVEE